MKKISLLLLTAVFVSCGTTINSVPLQKITENNIVLDQEYTKEIGSPLITKGDFLQQKSIKILNIEPFKISMVQFPYTNGDKLPLSGENKLYYFYYDVNKQLNNTYQIGIAENKKTGTFQPFVNSFSGGFNIKNVNNFEYEIIMTTPGDCDSCFKQEFIYNGRVNNDLKFVYREYVDNLARSSFNQELQYDINESNIVGFKGLRIEVLKTTNTSITYRILQSFE